MPDVVLREGDTVEGAGWRLAAVETPGHTSNHLCFALAEEGTLFSGDHVMGWSTSVITPPDGDMAAYMRSLEKLLRRERCALSADARRRDPPIRSLTSQAFIAHRNERTDSILARLAAGDETIAAIVRNVYVGLDPRLVTAAGRSVLAHLVALIEEGRVAHRRPAAPRRALSAEALIPRPGRFARRELRCAGAERGAGRGRLLDQLEAQQRERHARRGRSGARPPPRRPSSTGVSGGGSAPSTATGTRRFFARPRYFMRAVISWPM